MSPSTKPSRVITVAPMPPEKSAYALARYSRSPDSIRDSIEWVRTHNSEKFLESFYFQYGHASIADLGHLVMCFEGISEIAATEIEDEQLWDGQARSSRYQDFSKCGVITPPEFDAAQATRYQEAAARMLFAYAHVHQRMVEYLKGTLPKPEDMKTEAYDRNIAARAYDIARYCLILGIPTGVGQVVSIRTLEKQIRRLKASPFREIHELSEEIAQACASEPGCNWDDRAPEPIAPTLARFVDTDEHLRSSLADLRQWAKENVPPASVKVDEIDLMKPDHTPSEIVATLLYPVTTCPFRELYDLACSWTDSRRTEVIDLALRSRTRRDELSRNFRTSTYVYDIMMDIGAYRDLHRHRRCQQFRQQYTFSHGYDTPEAIEAAGLADFYRQAMASALDVYKSLPQPAAQYLLPFAARSRFLFKMDFAEAEYITRLRSGVKGHFSYRRIAWEMKEKLQRLEPQLANYLSATPPWVEDPLKR